MKKMLREDKLIPNKDKRFSKYSFPDQVKAIKPYVVLIKVKK